MRNGRKRITALYREWRRANGNRKPNRAVVRMHWEDGDNTEKGWQQDVVALSDFHTATLPEDDNEVLFYTGGLEGLIGLTRPGNGSEFVVDEVLEFYKHENSRTMNEYLATITLPTGSIEETFSATDEDDAWWQACRLFPECLEINVEQIDTIG